VTSSLAVAAQVSDAAQQRLRAAIVEHYDFVWRTLRRLGVPRHSIEDAAQQVLLVLARRMPEVQQGAERAFMGATAVRVAADARKKQARLREELDPVAIAASVSDSPSVEELVDQQRARELLDVVLGRMPDELRTVFVFFELEDMTTATIGELLSLPLGTVASRLRRARELFVRLAVELARSGRRP
jgi:RNA polymerase sigma-70 factor (ECF subfamily)